MQFYHMIYSDSELLIRFMPIVFAVQKVNEIFDDS
jgi:hypothetical protein